MPAALFLRQHIHFRLELRVRLDRSGLRQHHAPLDLILLNAPEQQPDVVPRLAIVQQLAEHLDARHHRLLVGAEPHHLDLFADLDLAAIDAARGDRAAARDRKDVFDRHQERLVDLALRHRNRLVERGEQFLDFSCPLLVALDGFQRRSPNHRHVIARELILREQLAHLELDQVQQLRVIDEVALVQEDHNGGDVHLPGEQNMLARLRHRTIDGAHDENRAVHLRRARDHVLHVIRMARAIDVRVVALRRRVLDVAPGNRENLGRVATALRLTRLRHLIVRHVRT